MKIIKEYTQWLNENYQPIFEDAGYTLASGLNPILKDESTKYQFILGKIPELLTKYNAFLAATPAGTDFVTFRNTVAKSTIKNINTDAAQQTIFTALVKGGQTAKKGFLGLFGKQSLEEVVGATIDSLIKGESQLKFTNPPTVCNYNLPGTDPNYVLTVGEIYTYGGKIKTGSQFQQKTSNISFLLAFCNAYNIDAFAKGAGQLILSTRLNAKGESKQLAPGYIDLESAPQLDNDNLYLYSQELTGTVVANTVVKTNTGQTGGVAGVEGHYAAEFAAGSVELTPALQAEVAKAVNLCLAKFPAGSRPDIFTLTCGASTEYGYPKKQMPKAAGTGPVTPTDDATKNQVLAYRRGVAFMTALNTGLKAKDHLGFDNYEVKWSIGASGKTENSADRFVDLNIANNAVKPKVIETTSAQGTQTGSAINSVKSQAKFFELKLTLITPTKQ